MRYKIFNGNPVDFQNGDSVPNLRYKGKVVMAIDPSKTNLALVIGDPGGDIITIIEMSGNNWSAGPVEDTTIYCSEVREFISRLLKNSEVYRIGLEKAITKKGMEHHHSNMVLTEIRGALLNLFWDEYRLKAKDVEVNNWTWKKYVLPDGYRSQNEKGSKRYFREYLGISTYEHYYEADVTDVLCIYQYLIRDCRFTYRIACQESEKSIQPYQLAIMPSYMDGVGFREFDYNPSFTVFENATYFANRSKRSGIAKVDRSRLTVDDIYKYASGFDGEVSEEKVRLLVVV